MPGIGRGPLAIRVQGGLEEGTGRHAKADVSQQSDGGSLILIGN